MPRRLSSCKILLLAGLAVIAVACFGQTTVPLYDGVNFPDEPYRYVAPPVSQKRPTPAPADVVQTYQLSQPVYGVYARSTEHGPQVYIYIDHSALVVPVGAAEFTLRAKPSAPTDQPAAGPIAGNVYTIAGDSDRGPLTLTDKDNKTFHTVDLRLPEGYPPKGVIVFKSVGGSWQTLNTTKVGNDIYEAAFDSFGQYAVIIPRQAAVARTAGGPLPIPLIVGASAVVLVMGAVVVGVRWAEHSKRKPVSSRAAAKAPAKKSVSLKHGSSKNS